MAQVSRNPRPLFVTALPSAPSDGMEVYYQSTTAGTGGGATNSMADVGAVWHLRYRSASSSSYKWEVIAASTLSAEVATSQTTTSGFPSALGTAGPLVTAPLAGDYDVAVGGALTAASNTGVQMSYDIGATPAVSSDGLEIGAGGLAAIPQVLSFRSKRKTFTASTTALVAKYGSSSGTVTIAYRYLGITPIRVG